MFVERRKEIEAIRDGIGMLKRDRARGLACRNRLAGLAEAVEENPFVRSSLQLPPVDVGAELRAFDANS